MSFEECYHVRAREGCRSSWRGRDLRRVEAGDREEEEEGRKKARKERSECSSRRAVRLVPVLSRDREWGAAGMRGEPLAT